MKRLTLYLFLTLGFHGLNSCASTVPSEEDVICSTIFKSILVTINGQELDAYYTIRISDQDTIRPPIRGDQSNTYTVLSDAYRPEMIPGNDSFHFVGLVNDSIIMEQPYVIGNGECHIYLTSGPTQINL